MVQRGPQPLPLVAPHQPLRYLEQRLHREAVIFSLRLCFYVDIYTCSDMCIYVDIFCISVSMSSVVVSDVQEALPYNVMRIAMVQYSMLYYVMICL